MAKPKTRGRNVLFRLYILSQLSNDLLDRATALTPGLEGPTVSPLQTEGWSAVRAMVRQGETNRIMDELWELGARAILVTSIHACRI